MGFTLNSREMCEQGEPSGTEELPKTRAAMLGWQYLGKYCRVWEAGRDFGSQIAGGFICNKYWEQAEPVSFTSPFLLASKLHGFRESLEEGSSEMNPLSS